MKHIIPEWDAEGTGLPVIVEVSEKAANSNGTHIEGSFLIILSFYPYVFSVSCFVSP